MKLDLIDKYQIGIHSGLLGLLTIWISELPSRLRIINKVDLIKDQLKNVLK